MASNTSVQSESRFTTPTHFGLGLKVWQGDGAPWGCSFAKVAGTEPQKETAPKTGDSVRMKEDIWRERFPEHGVVLESLRACGHSVRFEVDAREADWAGGRRDSEKLLNQPPKTGWTSIHWRFVSAWTLGKPFWWQAVPRGQSPKGQEVEPFQDYVRPALGAVWKNQTESRKQQP